MPIAKVNDVNLYYEIHGQGEPLLLIMGYGSNSGHWFVIRDRLAKEHRLIPSENSQILASRVANSELVILENAGHGFISDSAEESSKIILQFLKRH